MIFETFEKKQLQQHLSIVWSDIQQSVVDEAIDEWRRYLPLVSMQRDTTFNICFNIGCNMYSVTFLC